MFNKKTKKVMNWKDILWMNKIYSDYNSYLKIDILSLVDENVEDIPELSEKLEDLNITDPIIKEETKENDDWFCRNPIYVYALNCIGEIPSIIPKQKDREWNLTRQI